MPYSMFAVLLSILVRQAPVSLQSSALVSVFVYGFRVFVYVFAMCVHYAFVGAVHLYGMCVCLCVFVYVFVFVCMCLCVCESVCV